MSPAALVRRAVDQGGRKALKYSAASAISVVITQVLILTLHGPAGLSATVTNVVAVSAAAVPAYFLNRAWVWGKRGRSHFRREVLPFWGFALAGLALSTAVVSVVTDLWSAPVAVNLANIGSFGVLWVTKYLVLDALLFGEGTVSRVDPAAVPELIA